MFSLDYAAFDSVTKLSYLQLFVKKVIRFSGSPVHRKKKCYFMYGYLQGVGTFVEVETSESTLTLKKEYSHLVCVVYLGIVPTLRRILMVRFRIPYCSQVRGTLF